MEPLVDARIKDMLDLVKTHYCAPDTSSSATAKPMNLASQTLYFALDVITDFGFDLSLAGNTSSATDFDNYIYRVERDIWSWFHRTQLSKKKNRPSDENEEGNIFKEIEDTPGRLMA
jgi:hypothetical protein